MLSISSLVVLSGCATTHSSLNQPVTTKEMPQAAKPTAISTEHEEFLKKTLLQSRLDQQNGIVYRVGPGDVLRIDVYRHPGLSFGSYSSVAAVGSQPSRQGGGIVVDNNGTIQYPLLGVVQVAGKTPEEVRQLLQNELSRYVKNPSVTVQVISNGSMRYNLLGEFTNPGMKFVDRPMDLMDALALGGSVNMEKADLRGAYLARNGQKLPINFYRLLRHGDLTQNIRLRPGDTIVIPDKASQQAFVFGDVSKGGAVPFSNGRLELLQALSEAGFNFSEITRSHLEDVRIIRPEGDRALFITVNATKILKGEAAPFFLESGDIVYVPLNKLGSWNEAVNQILPSLNFVAGLLNPFVQIKFLRQ